MRWTARAMIATTPTCTPRKIAATSGCCEVDPGVEPGEREDQHRPGKHEAEPGEDPADPAAADHAEMHAKLMRLGSGQHLVDGEQAVEARRLDPSLFLDQLALDHPDLRDRPAPGEEAEPQEAQEELRR